jgi:hypothetical protein
MQHASPARLVCERFDIYCSVELDVSRFPDWCILKVKSVLPGALRSLLIRCFYGLPPNCLAEVSLVPYTPALENMAVTYFKSRLEVGCSYVVPRALADLAVAGPIVESSSTVVVKDIVQAFYSPVLRHQRFQVSSPPACLLFVRHQHTCSPRLRSTRRRGDDNTDVLKCRSRQASGLECRPMTSSSL